MTFKAALNYMNDMIKLIPSMIRLSKICSCGVVITLEKLRKKERKTTKFAAT